MKLRLVVNGEALNVTPEISRSLRSLVAEVLEQTHNTGRPAKDWQVRTAAGVLVEQDKPLDEYPFQDGDILFVNPGAGFGGAVGYARVS